MMNLPKYLVLDGGLSTEISKTHPDINGDPLWSARLLKTDPACIRKVHTSFMESGSDVIETVTYQASVGGFVKHLVISEEDSYALIRKGAEVACESRDHFWKEHSEAHSDRIRPLVAGSVGPYGACLADGSEYSGSYIESMTAEKLKCWHEPRIKALIEGGVDLLAVDTIPALAEAEALADLLHDEFPHTPVWISFSCKDGLRTCHGELFSDAVRRLAEFPQIIGVGINCTSPFHVSSLLASVPQEVKQQLPLLVYPNSGESWSEDKKWNGEPVSLGHYLPEWIGLGARWFGGCCRVSPEEISNMRKVLIHSNLIG